jgi:hypothetical protein
MSAEELAALVCEALRTAGITVTLTGGACVAIWSDGKYVSNDLDFVEEGPVPLRKIAEVMKELGFTPRGRHFVHPETKLFVEFPTGPLTVGEERIERVSERETSTGKLRLLSPTDCVKDRLAAFFHWNDRQCLDQALLVAASQKIDLADVRRWSHGEDQAEKFEEFARQLKRRKRVGA